MDLLHILEICLVIIDMDVSDGGWTTLRNMSCISYDYWIVCFAMIDMDVSDGGWTAFLKMPWIFYIHIGFGPCDN